MSKMQTVRYGRDGAGITKLSSQLIATCSYFCGISQPWHDRNYFVFGFAVELFTQPLRAVIQNTHRANIKRQKEVFFHTYTVIVPSSNVMSIISHFLKFSYIGSFVIRASTFIRSDASGSMGFPYVKWGPSAVESVHISFHLCEISLVWNWKCVYSDVCSQCL